MPTFPEKAIDAMARRMLNGEWFTAADLIAIARAEGVTYVCAAGKAGNMIQAGCAARVIEWTGDKESGIRWRATSHTSR